AGSVFRGWKMKRIRLASSTLVVDWLLENVIWKKGLKVLTRNYAEMSLSKENHTEVCSDNKAWEEWGFVAERVLNQLIYLSSFQVESQIFFVCIILSCQKKLKNDYAATTDVAIQLSQSLRKGVQVCESVSSGTLPKGYRWKDRHGIEKILCRVANSL
nr:hypothetical protein [Tanacetum cinerariifolium]